MILNLTELSSEPLNEQIAAQLLQRILSGDLEAGHCLEAARVLARSERVSIRSVERAYETLEKEGVIRSVDADRSVGADRYVDAGRYVVMPMNHETKEQLRLRRQERPVDASEWRRMQADMAMARQVQANLLPKNLPDGPELRVAAYARSSLAVGGDFYDVIPLDDNRVAVVIADASGKGLPAAMMISQLHGMFRSEINNGNDIPTTLRNINDHIAAFSSPEKFATVFFGIFNRSTGVFEFANAGHNHPVLMRANGMSEPLTVGGTILGIFPGANFTTESVFLTEGDLLFLYTDGVTETRNTDDEEYGETRLINLLRRNRDRSAHEVIEAAINELNEFQATEPLQDDRTCLVLKAEEVAAKVTSNDS